ncbi:MAG: alpha/beta fold hydrolase [Chthoniobacteraceae bacterium]
MFVAFGAMTFMHAWSMTHYAEPSVRTTRAAELSGWGRLLVMAKGATIRRQINKRAPNDIGLEFSTRTFTGAHGLKLEAWCIPGTIAAPAVLMFPGYGGSKDTLLPAAKEFAALGWEIWLIDPHGIGGSEGTTTSIGWHEATDVAAAFREFRSGSNGACVLYGTSMGAVAILRAAHEGWVKPDALILECPFDRFTHPIATGYGRFGLPGNLFGPATAFWVGAQQGFNAFDHNPVEYISSVRCPVLLLQGEDDDTIGRAYVRAVGNGLGPNGTFAFLPGAGHAFLVTGAAKVWKSSMRSFASRTFPGSEVR